MNKTAELSRILAKSKNVVFFGGAGMSTESGIPDFRSAQGIYNEKLNRGVSPEEMVSHSFFVSHTEEFYAFYREKLVYPDAEPNAGHRALAELEKKGILRAVVTQNVDGLHQKAGSETVYELHGSVLRNYCMKCHAFYPVEYVLQEQPVPHCEKCGGVVRPDTVLYGEDLDLKLMARAMDAIRKADTLIVGGTSLAVYPAADLIKYFHGKHLVLINKSETSADAQADLVIHDSIGQVLSESVEALS